MCNDDILYNAFMEDDVIKINGPEEIDPSKDTYPHNYAKTSYNHARKERLDDVVFDYISDENVDATQFYEELKQSIQDCVDYFEKYSKKSNNMLELVTKNKVELF